MILIDLSGRLLLTRAARLLLIPLRLGPFLPRLARLTARLLLIRSAARLLASRVAGLLLIGLAGLPAELFLIGLSRLSARLFLIGLSRLPAGLLLIGLARLSAGLFLIGLAGLPAGLLLIGLPRLSAGLFLIGLACLSAGLLLIGLSRLPAGLLLIGLSRLSAGLLLIGLARLPAGLLLIGLACLPARLLLIGLPRLSAGLFLIGLACLPAGLLLIGLPRLPAGLLLIGLACLSAELLLIGLPRLSAGLLLIGLPRLSAGLLLILLPLGLLVLLGRVVLFLLFLAMIEDLLDGAALIGLGVDRLLRLVGAILRRLLLPLACAGRFAIPTPFTRRCRLILLVLLRLGRLVSGLRRLLFRLLLLVATLVRIGPFFARGGLALVGFRLTLRLLSLLFRLTGRLVGPLVRRAIFLRLTLRALLRTLAVLVRRLLRRSGTGDNVDRPLRFVGGRTAGHGLLVVARFGPVGDAVAGLQPQAAGLEGQRALELPLQRLLRCGLIQQRAERQTLPGAITLAGTLGPHRHLPQREVGIFGPHADLQSPVLGQLHLALLGLEDPHVRRQVGDHFDAMADRPGILPPLAILEAELVAIVLGLRRVIFVQTAASIAPRPSARRRPSAAPGRRGSPSQFRPARFPRSRWHRW